jgi:hypothetical protein
MSKEESLSFLQSCIDKVNLATEQDIQFYKEMYNKDCAIPIIDVLDKIKAEIKQTTSRYTISRERGAMGQVEWSDRLIKESEVLEILDKYKAEREEEE